MTADIVDLQEVDNLKSDGFHIQITIMLLTSSTNKNIFSWLHFYHQIILLLYN